MHEVNSTINNGNSSHPAIAVHNMHSIGKQYTMLNSQQQQEWAWTKNSLAYSHSKSLVHKQHQQHTQMTRYRSAHLHGLSTAYVTSVRRRHTCGAPTDQGNTSIHNPIPQSKLRRDRARESHSPLRRSHTLFAQVYLYYRVLLSSAFALSFRLVAIIIVAAIRLLKDKNSVI